jgi:hypothetical protein
MITAREKTFSIAPEFGTGLVEIDYSGGAGSYFSIRCHASSLTMSLEEAGMLMVWLTERIENGKFLNERLGRQELAELASAN